jgi:hypothetical protein
MTRSPDELVHAIERIMTPTPASSIQARMWVRFSVRAVNADGVPCDSSNLILTRGARRLAFLGGDDAMVIL